MEVSKVFILLLLGFAWNALLIQCEDPELCTSEESECAGSADEATPDTDEAKETSNLDVKEEDNVLVLTTANFDNVIASHKIILVEFYAPWCGHCKNLAPEYAKAAKKLKGGDNPVALGKVDATIEKELGSRFGVQGYPTLKFFKDGEVNDYNGPREEAGIVSYMKERADPNWVPPKSLVVDLTKDNFDEFTRKSLVLVEFYAPWCGHCKRLAPEYEQASITLADVVPLGKVDATVESELASQYDIKGYPTLKVFRRGKAYDYKGETRSARDISGFMKSLIGPTSEEILSLKRLQKALLPQDISIVGFFDGPEDEAYLFFDAFSHNLRQDYEGIFHTFDKSARDHYKVNAGSLVVLIPAHLLSKYEPKWFTMELKADSDEAAVMAFIEDHELPLAGQLTKANWDRVLKEGHKPFVLFFCDIDWSFDGKVASERNRQRVVDIAKDYRDAGLVFVVADETEIKDMFKEFGFEDSGEDLNVGILAAGDKKYPMAPMEDGYEEGLVRSFIDSFLRGDLKPRIKSQPAPKKQGVVTTVVGNTFDKIVMDTSKDVLIEFYAPWCGHCKKLEPKYKELAKKYKKNKNLIIAKMDATGNDAPEQFDVKGYPTTYFATASRKSDPFLYSGGHEVDDFVKFIEENAEVSLKNIKKEEL